MNRTVGLLVAGGLCTVSIACGAEPGLEFADWAFPVAEGTPIKDYAPVPLEERAACR